VLSLVRAAIFPSSASDTPPPAFIDVAPNRMQFYSQHDQSPGRPPVRVLLIAQGGVLREEVTRPTGTAPNYTYSTANRTVRVLARGLETNSIFQFSTDPTPGAAPMSITGTVTAPATLGTIVSIGSTLTVNTDQSPRTQPVTMSGRVRLPN